MKHLDGIREKVRRAALAAPPAPWKQVASIAVGGLTAVGIDRDSELLLIVSSQGRGVFDTASGQRIARDREPYDQDDQHLEAEGIGPLAGLTIKTAGLAGGSLPLGTDDGWSVELVPMDWPFTEVLLFAPGAWLYGSLHNMPDAFTKLASESELRAAGFSPSGASLIVATSSDVVVFGRPRG